MVRLMISFLWSSLLMLGVSQASGKHEPMNWTLWQKLLKEHVKKGVVDYKGLKEKEAQVEQVVRQLKKARPRLMSKKAQMAFWINAYNIFTVRLMLKNYPLETIKEIPANKRWKSREWVVEGKYYSLDDIEHKNLRPMGDPRIHFAINCASFSCPDLDSRPFEAKDLDEHLDRVQEEFLLNSDKGATMKTENSWLVGEKKIIYLSKIFSWFAKDFEDKSGSVQKYLQQYAPKKIKDFMKDKEVKLKYMSYDWKINGK